MEGKLQKERNALLKVLSLAISPYKNTPTLFFLPVKKQRAFAVYDERWTLKRSFTRGFVVPIVHRKRQTDREQSNSCLTLQKTQKNGKWNSSCPCVNHSQEGEIKCTISHTFSYSLYCVCSPFFSTTVVPSLPWAARIVWGFAGEIIVRETCLFFKKYSKADLFLLFWCCLQWFTVRTTSTDSSHGFRKGDATPFHS